jgi:hypothetical protein
VAYSKPALSLSKGPVLLEWGSLRCAEQVINMLRNWLRSYFNPAKRGCRNIRPDAMSNATKTPCPMAIFRAR